MAKSYIKGNLINIFYKTGTDTWAYFAYGQSHSLQISSSTTEISSKDHGNHPDQEVSSTTFTMSGEFYFTKDNATKAIAMANAAKPITFAFAKVADNATGTLAADGLSGVTGYGDTAAFTIDSSAATSFVEYGNGIITSASITAQQGEVATISIDITGQGALSTSEPSTTYTYSAS
jgi:hypothetical protein